MTIEEVVHTIVSDPFHHRSILISIDGFGGAGKTTLANILKEKLVDAYVVNIDDFIIKEKFSYPSWENGTFDRARLEKQVLIPASRGDTVHFQRLIWNTGELSNAVEIPEVKYLIIEGITSTHPGIASYYDYKIWVDAQIEIAKERGKQRDRAIGNQFDELWELWAKNDLEYQNKYHPESKADFVINTEEL